MLETQLYYWLPATSAASRTRLHTLGRQVWGCRERAGSAEELPPAALSLDSHKWEQEVGRSLILLLCGGQQNNVSGQKFDREGVGGLPKRLRQQPARDQNPRDQVGGCGSVGWAKEELHKGDPGGLLLSLTSCPEVSCLCQGLNCDNPVPHTACFPLPPHLACHFCWEGKDWALQRQGATLQRPPDDNGGSTPVSKGEVSRGGTAGSTPPAPAREVGASPPQWGLAAFAALMALWGVFGTPSLQPSVRTGAVSFDTWGTTDPEPMPAFHVWPN